MVLKPIGPAPMGRELERRWRELLERVAAGRDVEPARVLRCEGFMEALVALELCDPEELDAAFERLRGQVLGTPADDALRPAQGDEPMRWADWRALHPFPALCLHQRRAPVHTTGGLAVENYEPD